MRRMFRRTSTLRQRGVVRRHGLRTAYQWKIVGSAAAETEVEVEVVEVVVEVDLREGGCMM